MYVHISATVPSGTIVECSRVYVGSWDPWDPGTVVLEIPKGFLRDQEPIHRNPLMGPFFDDFFDLVLGTSFFRSLKNTRKSAQNFRNLRFPSSETITVRLGLKS